MHTIRLKISDQIFDKIMWLLSKFSKEEVEIIQEDEHLAETRKYLHGELNEIKEGKAKFINEEEAEYRLNNILKKR